MLKAEVEPLEPRILLSADLAPFAVAMMADQTDLTLSLDVATDMIQVHDTITGTLVAEKARAETSAIEIEGTDGDDVLHMDMAGSYIFPDSIWFFPDGISFSGGEGNDQLIGEDGLDATWILDGIDSGSVEGLNFDSVEVLTGGADNEDRFLLTVGSQSTGGLQGGAGGFDIVEIDAGGLPVGYTPTAPDAGGITIGDLTTLYTGMEPVDTTGTSGSDLVFNLDNTANTGLTLSFVSNAGGTDTFALDGPGIETHNFGVTAGTTSVTINLGDGADEIAISGVEGTHLDGILAINAEGGDDTISLGADYGTLDIDGGTGADVLEIDLPAVQGLPTPGVYTTTVIGDQVTTQFNGLTIGVANLQPLSDFTTITGDSIVLDVTNVIAAVDAVFGTLAGVLETAGDTLDLISALPLIGGSNLVGQADVTLARALDLYDTLDNARAQILKEIQSRVADGLQVSEIEDAIAAATATVEGIAPAAMSVIATTAANVQAAVLADLSDFFGFTVESKVRQADGTLDTITETFSISASDVNNAIGDIVDGVALDGLTALNSLVSAELGSTDLSGLVVPTINAGRIAFQAVSDTVEEIKVRASNASADNLAAQLLGFDAVEYVTLTLDQITNRLTALGNLEFGFDNVNLSIQNATNLMLDFDFEASRRTEFGFDFGEEADGLGLSFDASAKLLLAAGFAFDADFNINATNPSNVTFSGAINQFGLGAEIESSGLTANASVGVVTGSATGDVFLDIALVDDGAVSFSNTDSAATLLTQLGLTVGGFDYNFGNDTFTFQAAGQQGYSVALSLTADANLVSATLDIGVSGLFDGTPPTVTFSGGFEQDFLDFNNLTPTEIVRAVADFALWLQDTADSDLLAGIDIPFLEGALDDITQIGKVVSDQLLYDYGGDGVKDGEAKLVTDLNNALLAAGLDAYLEFEGFGSGFKLNWLDPDISSVQIIGGNAINALGLSINDLLTDGLEFDGTESALDFLTGNLALGAASLATTIRVNFNGGGKFDGTFELLQSALDENTGIGDDVAKLIDRFNAPTFKSIQEFIVRLDDIGVLDAIGFNANDLSSFYDESSDQLLYNVNLGGSDLFDVEIPTDFELDLGNLLNINSTSRLVISGGASLDLGLGFDLSTGAGGGGLPGPAGDLELSTVLENIGISQKQENAVTGDVAPVAQTDMAFTLILTEDGGPDEVIEVSLTDVDLKNASPAKLAANFGAYKADILAQINAELAGTDITATFVDEAPPQATPAIQEYTRLTFTYTGAAAAHTLEIDNDADGFSTDPAAALLGLWNTGSTTGTLSAAEAIQPFSAAGVISDDLVFEIDLDGDTYQITLPNTATLSVQNGQLTSINSSIVSLVADVKAALAEARDTDDLPIPDPLNPPPTVDLTGDVTAAFQGTRLVLTLTEGSSYTNLELTSAVPELGFDTSLVADSADLLLTVDDTGSSDDVLIKVSFDGAVTIQDALDDIAAAVESALGLSPGDVTGNPADDYAVYLTPDDPLTAKSEAGKSISVKISDGSYTLKGLSAINGSPTAVDLGLIGADVNPNAEGDTPDGIVQGADIGGIRLIDRFFIKSDVPVGATQSELASLEFSAQAGRLVKDLQLAGDDILFSSSLDLRNFVEGSSLAEWLEIEILDVAGFADGVYKIKEVATGSIGGNAVDGVRIVDASDGSSVDVGTADQAGGKAIIRTGIDASASLGFVGVELTGEALFGVELALGFNAGTGKPAEDGIVTLGEVVDVIDAAQDDGVSALFDLFVFPELTANPGPNFGTANLELALAGGSPGFDAIANALLNGNDSISASIDLIALGDPFMQTRLDQAGNFDITDGDTFVVDKDFTDLLPVGATLRFEKPVEAGQTEPTVFEAKIAAVNFSGGVSTIDLDPASFVHVSGAEVTTLTASDVLTDFTDITLRPSVNVNLPDFGALSDVGFGSFDLDTLLDALVMLADALSAIEGFDFLDVKLPVIDKSLHDLFSLADDLRDFVDGLRANPAGSLQFVESALNDAIGLSAATLEEAYDLAYGTGGGNDAPDQAFVIGYDTAAGKEMLTFSLNLGAAFSDAINVGLSDLPFADDLFNALGDLGPINFSGSAGLAANGGIFLTIGLGIDLGELATAATDGDSTTGVEDAFYLLEETGLAASIGAQGSNLAFNAGLGPLALAIGNNGSDAAEIAISAGAQLATQGGAFTDGRLSLEDLVKGDVALGSAFALSGIGGGAYGEISGRLPVFFPTDSNHIGDILIGTTYQEEVMGSSGSDFGALDSLVTVGPAALKVLTGSEDDPTPVAADVVIDVSQLTEYFTTFNFAELSIFDNIRLAADGFDLFLGLLEENIFGELAELNLPIVGEGFGDAANFIGDFREGFVGNLRIALDAVEDAADDFADPDKNIISKLIFDLLGPNGLGLLKLLDVADRTGNGGAGDYILLNATGYQEALDTGQFNLADISWDFDLGTDGQQELANVPLDFDIGIPGLGLETTGAIEFLIDWGIGLGFGLSAQKGFYFDFDDTEDDVYFNVEVGLEDGSSVSGSLGFLGLTATDRETGFAEEDVGLEWAGTQTGLTANVGLDILLNGVSADKVSMTELGSLGLMMGIDVVAAAALDLTLGLDEALVGDALANGFPSVEAGFDFLWTFSDTYNLIGGSTDKADLDVGIKYLAFGDVGLNLGEFVTDVLGPIVDAVAEYTKPLQPFIDFLTAPVPVVDVFGIDLTMLDLAAALGNFDPGLIETLAEVITLINDIAALRDGPGELDLIVPIGDFVIFDNIAGGGGTGDNPFADGFSGLETFNDRDAAGAFDDAAAAFLSALDDSTTTGGDKNKDAAKTVTKLKAGGSFDFPIINDPAQIFGLLMGNPATLVTFDLDPLIVGFEKSFFFSIFGPLGVSLGLTIEFTADFAFGYDTQGISDFVDSDFRNPLLLFNGLFISDTENPDGSGADVPELTFLGGITAAAELNLGIARAGVAGGLFIEILFDLFDPDNDGKVRITELASNFTNQLRAPTDGEKLLAPLAIFDVTGEIFARLFAFLKIDFGFFEVDKEWDFVDPITLLDFEIDFFRPPVVASEASTGDLIINIGDFAEQRLLGNATDFGETVNIQKVSQSGDDITVAIWTDPNGFGEDSPIVSNKFEYIIKAGAALVVRAGAGDDVVNLIDWDGDEVLFDIEGGIGNDRIEFSGGGTGSNTTFNRLIGGLGNDTIIGSGGRDLVEGGAGNDDVDGGAGADLVLGDQVDFFASSLKVDLLGNAGRDTVAGGDGDDIVIGGGGQDSIEGNDGNDLILGDGGEIQFMSTGQKILSNVYALHEGGVTKTDKLNEGEKDTIDAGGGNDVVFASGGNDDVLGGTGADAIFGGAGFDTVDGGDGADLILGDIGGILASLLNTPQSDLLSNMSALSNSSDIVQLANRIALASGGASDSILGGGDNDLIFGQEGNDTVLAGDGDDLVYLGAGADSAEGQGGNDTLLGEGQADFLRGNDDNDVLDGGTGADTAFGDGGADVIISAQGADSVNGGSGSDTYRVNLSGGTTESLIEISDGGISSSDVDVLEVNGTDRADHILLRADVSGNNAFVANLNGEFNVERINYDKTLERIIVSGGAGDDIFASDDTSAEITIYGDSGNDSFQIGQLFREARFVNEEKNQIPTGIATDDFFATIEVTRGWLSNGISFPMTINGGIGDDNFTVYHNKAVLTLNGEAGDDIFEVRAFALVGSQEPQRERTDLTGGDGADTVRYAVNAPVNINGGDGFDTLIVIGTEFGDDFVITDDGVFGAGLNVNFVNIESLRIDGAEGNDRFFLQSTLETVLTELFGGLGDDTFFTSGETPPVVSNDFRGHSGIITHEMTAGGDVRYDGQTVFGISANVADDDTPFAILTETQGSTIVTEGDATGDSYTVRLTKAPTEDVFVTIGAPLPSPSLREQGIYAFRLDVDAVALPDAVVRGDGSSVVLKFTAGNWDTAQTVQVIADGVMNDYPGGLFTRQDIAGDTFSDPENFDFDDTAYEGPTNAVITHTFSSGRTVQGLETAGDLVAVDNVAGTMTINKLGMAQDELLGKTISIVEGEGFGDFRFIVGVVDNGADYTLTLSEPWDEGKVPTVGGSQNTVFNIRLDDSITGTHATSVEMKAEEIFDDRTVFTGKDSAGAALDFEAVYGDLTGFTLQIIGGTGAGQEMLILGTDGEELTLNAIWSIDPDSDSVFRISRYDGLNSQVVEVLINDNDMPGLNIDQTSDLNGDGTVDTGISNDTITAVIEGADGNQNGEGDVLTLSLSQPLTGGQTMTMDLDYDTAQIKVVAAGDGPGGTAITALNYSSGVLSHLVEVWAVDDQAREGAHTAKIDFSFSNFSGIPASDGGSETLTLQIDATDPRSSVGTTFKPDSITGVFLNGSTESLPVYDENVQAIGLHYHLIEGSNQILFYDGDDIVEISGTVEIQYSYSQITYQQAFGGSVLVRIADDDAPTLLVRETQGRTDVIEGGPTDTYELRLTSAPVDGTVDINLSEIITKTTKTGGIRYDNIQVEIIEIKQGGATISGAALDALKTQAMDDSGNLLFDESGAPVMELAISFDDTNWDVPVLVTVEAVQDSVVDGDDTQVFAPSPATLAQILGPVITNGAGGNGSLFGLADPLMLPGETNVKAPVGEFGPGDIDNGEATPSLTVSRDDLTAEVMIDLRLRANADDLEPGDAGYPGSAVTDAEIEALIGKTLEITRAPAAPETVDQFRLITDVIINGDNTVTLLLNAPYDLSPVGPLELTQSFDPADANLPGNAGHPAETDTLESTLDDPVNRYALTSESLNFFVNELVSVDVLFVKDDDSPADSAGTLTSNRLFGFNMGPDTVIGERARQGGITYGELEVVDITLGVGYNNLNVIGTGTRSDGYETRTIIRTGTEVPVDAALLPGNPLVGAPVGDTVTVNLLASDDTLLSGTTYTVENPFSGNDYETVFTMDTDPGVADDFYLGQKLVLTIDVDGQTQTIERWIVGSSGDTLELDDPIELEAGTVGIGWDIVDPADGALSVDLQGGEDMLTATGDRGLVVFGGTGQDTITTAAGDDIVFGDLGRVDYFNALSFLLEGDTEPTPVDLFGGFSAIVTRLGEAPEAFLGFVDGQFTNGDNIDTDQNIFPVADTSLGTAFDDPFETGDIGLAGLYVDINDGTGFETPVKLITGNTNEVLDIVPALTVDLAADSRFRISTLPEDQADGFSWQAGLILAIAGDGANDVIDTGAGNDTVMGGEGDDDINLGAGNDIGFGDLGMVRNTFLGGDNPQPSVPGEIVPTYRDGVFAIQIGIGGDDTISGGDGNDLLIGGAGSDDLSGDAGDDTIMGDVGFADYTDGVLGTLETYRTEGAADLIAGGFGSDVILGGLGGDTIAGDEVIPTGSNLDGNDVILGDHGRVDYAFDDTVAPTESTILRIEGVLETIDGGDMITGNAGADTIIGGSDADLIRGDDETAASGAFDLGDLIFGDTAEIDFAVVGGALSLLSRVATRELAATTGGNDTIEGTAGADTIFGGVGMDTIRGDDATPDGTLDGADRLIGDNGEMTFEADGLTISAMRSFEDGLGDVDDISGNAEADWIIGGYGGDLLHGNDQADYETALDGADVILGDNGEIVLSGGSFTDIRTFDTGEDPLDSNNLLLPFAADDTITGDAGGDIILGGLGADLIRGDHSLATDSDEDGADVILGDNGEVVWGQGGFDNYVRTIAFTHDTDDEERGASDTISGNTGNDLILGGTGGDLILGGTQDDTVLGDHGFAGIIGGSIQFLSIRQNADGIDDTNAFGGNDTIFGDEHEDVLIGGLGSDVIDGDNVEGRDDPLGELAGRDLIFGDNVELDRRGAVFGEFTDPRYTTLQGNQLYSVDAGEMSTGDAVEGLLLDTGTPFANPDGTAAWGDYEIEILDHDQNGADNGLFGDDYIAGGGAQDSIFGQLGDDVIQGDGGVQGVFSQEAYLTTEAFDIDRTLADGIATDGVYAYRDGNGVLQVNASFETIYDDDDYIEGNGGDDVVFGGLGQDDIVGDNSSFFSLDASERFGLMVGGTDIGIGSDMIFGGSGQRIERNEYTESPSGVAGEVVDILIADRHSRDADMVMGDNGDIFRILGASGQYLSFNYDTLDDVASEHYGAGDLSRGTDRIVIRGADLLDYTEGGDAFGAPSYGVADEVHGEGGDDSVYGMVGDDSLFGDADDDDIIGGHGNDWISGGTGLDGVIGSDGRIYTSRNLDAPSGSGGPTHSEAIYGIGFVDTNQFISTPGKIQQSTIHLEGYLKKTVDLTPFFPENEADVPGLVDRVNNSDDVDNDDNDIIFGGLGSDSLHGGYGSDAISGAEAMRYPELGLPLPYTFDNPGNPGDILAYGTGVDAEGNPRPNEFAAYDEFNPRPEVWVDPVTFSFVDPLTPGAVPFVLNFDPTDGAATDPITGDGPATASDGNDVIFGDLGHDWLVGGTGRDHIYGGFGDDLLNADDDHDTGGANDTPDTANSYADIAYGGGGRDILIGNTGGDRLIDWVGEFNSYIVPFAPFGAFTISRNVQPQIFDYVYDLSEADGADTTRIVDGDAARNGEPYGEIGAVKQQDDFWQDQTGAPDDPQPGNIPGGKRDTMAAESFNGADALVALAADSGQWSTEAGKAVIAPEAKGLDGVSVYHVAAGYLPTYFEITASLAAEKDRAGYDSNGFLIYDYQSPTDFKFAGINADTKKIQIGHRDETGWIVDAQSNMQLWSDTFYDVLVSVNGTTVTLLVDGKKSVAHTFDPRVVDGIPQGLNAGMIGVGADNSFTQVDNLTVQVLPPNLSYANTEDFEDGAADYFTGTSVGDWSVAGGAFGVDAGAGFALATVDLSTDAGYEAGAFSLEDNAKLRLTADVTTSGEAGIVFDLVSNSRFKFAMVDAATNTVEIGHYEGNGKWAVDYSVAVAGGIDADTTYEMSLIISGSTVSVTLDGVVYGSHAFNAVSVDGQSGLIARDGTASFDSFKLETDDARIAVEIVETLRASETGTGGEAVAFADADALMDEAIRRMALTMDLSQDQVAVLERVDLTIGDLSGDVLATYGDGLITLDVDGAGTGYFIDETAHADQEFLDDGSAREGSDADGRYDLLTILMHELGHALDLSDTSDEHDLMGGFLDPSQRLGLFKPANTDSEPYQASANGSGEATYYDPRVDAMVTEDELLLLDSVEDVDTETVVTTGKGKGRVKWAAE